MGLDDVVRSAVATANSVIADLQDNITLAPWTGSDSHGAPTHGTAVTFSAIVNRRVKPVRSVNGELVMSKAQIIILEPVAANGATGRHEPIDARDIPTLPDGDTGKILETEGLYDPSTHAGYYHVIDLG